MKFSIIIPIYNVEKYLEKCLNSVLNQTYKNYEVILVCDKSDDNSEKIADDYINNNKNFIKIYAERTGLSKARNLGLEKISGEYILFLDSDDYLDEKLLEVLNNNIEKNTEIIRFQVRDVICDKKIEYLEETFNTMNGIDAFNLIKKYHYIETAWSYCYKTSFWKKNKFKYVENVVSEDYGLTPYILYKSKYVKSINFVGYNYVYRNGSLINYSSYDKKLRRLNDMISQATYFKNLILINEKTYIFHEFYDDSIIYLITTLKFKDYLVYKKLLKENNVLNSNNNNFKRKIKYISPWLYYKIYRRIVK